jgi:BirA family transcriptional regulator, biotin operon repressor / biotin---[acetyl-CoA-carboxylase] ligase
MVSRVTYPGANSARFRVEWVAETGSTNADALDRAREGEPDGLVIAADHQRTGRGRLERRWEAPPGANLLVSLLLRPQLAPSEWHRCTTAVAVAAVEACASAGVVTRIKWPNDLVVGTDSTGMDKLAGILAETDPVSGAVVVGLGLNVGWPLPGEYPGATSLVARGSTIRRDDLLDSILDRVDERAVDLHDRYLARNATIGRTVEVHLPDGTSVSGVARTVDPDGRLLVATSAGDRSFTVGDVVHATPTH